MAFRCVGCVTMIPASRQASGAYDADDARMGTATLAHMGRPMLLGIALPPRYGLLRWVWAVAARCSAIPSTMRSAREWGPLALTAARQ
jgi:hypothetical protein